MKKYDIIFIDIDGTLRNSSGNISNESKQMIKEIKEKGILVVLCTGRSHKYALKVAKEVDSSDYIISSNGSEVTNIKTGEVIFNKAINKSYLESIFTYCENNDVNLLLNTIKEDYQTIDESTNRKLIHNINEVNDDVNQIVITSKKYDRMLVIPDMFKEKYPELKLNSSSKDLKLGNRHPLKDYYHDFNSDNISKATGVVELLDYLKIPKERCITIGDSDNDISMCEVAGYCVAMGNAIKSLKQVADEIINTNDDDGVSKFLEGLL